MKVTEDALARLGGLLGLLGDPEHNTETLFAFRELLFSAKRKTPIERVIACIPPQPDALRRLEGCVMAYTRMGGAAPRYPFKKVTFNPERVIEVMLKIEDPDAFVSAAVQEGFHHPGAVFHPAALEHISTAFRGVLGELADTAYADDMDDRINVLVVGDE